MQPQPPDYPTLANQLLPTPFPPSHRSLATPSGPLSILCFPTLTSTMSISQLWPTELTHGRSFLFTAKQQTHGRGQRTNQWISPPGNVYMALLVRTRVEVLGHLAATVTRCVAGRIQGQFGGLGERLGLKWVNDVYVGQRKISGNLIRSSIEGLDAYVEIGIGVNINVAPSEATCVRTQLKLDHQLSQEIIDQFMQKLAIDILADIERLPQGASQIMEQYHKMLRFRDEWVKIYDFQLKEVLHEGKFIGVSEYGFAILEDKQGKRVQVNHGKMRQNQP